MRLSRRGLFGMAVGAAALPLAPKVAAKSAPPLWVYDPLTETYGSGWALVTKNKTTDITILKAGSGYTSSPTISIRGDGRTAVLTRQGRVVK